MKKQFVLLLFVFLLISRISYGDVIPDHSHYVDKCVKITNIEDYPDVSLLGFIPPGTIHYDTYLISSAECLTKGYKYNDFNVIAFSKTYLAGKDIKKMDLPRDPNALFSNIHIEPFGGYVNDSIHITAKEQYYKIAGFSKTNVILYLCKEVNKFNDGKPDSTSTYTYNGDVTLLSQKIQTGTNAKELKSSFELYPNPANKKFHLKINNIYVGKVSIEITGLDGKVAKSLTVDKLSYRLDADVNIENLHGGTYTVSLKFGKSVESKKMVIK